MAIENYKIALTIVGIVDAISYMLVTPSLVFYVLQNGGNKDQYGIIMSAFSFSSFLTKPVIGWWSDKQGFRTPYVASLSIALLGGFVYVLASALPSGRIAVGAILGSRLLGGCGAANSALGFAYVARSVPPKEQTSVNSLLSLCRILGMAVGPAVNILVSKVNIPIGENWALDSLNSVGLIIVLSNMTAMAGILYFLEEPKDDHSDLEGSSSSLRDESGKNSDSSSSPGLLKILANFASMDLLVPLLSIFGFNANFQLIETGFAPAANDGLGWGPVESSVALGSISVVIAANMIIVMTLSKKGVSDSNMLCGGLILSAFAYMLLYLMWVKDSSALQFYIPVLLGACSFPYLAATTRSIFTLAVNAKPALKNYHGSMQAVLSMGASVAGFVTPGIVAAYCLRHPEDVVASTDKRELTTFALFAPVLSLLTLAGMIYLRLSGSIAANLKLASVAAASIPSEQDDTFQEGIEPTAVDRESLQKTESSALLPGRKRRSHDRRSSNLSIMLEGPIDGLERPF